ncbi:pyridine nucleotide-disulfide oxidoreductase [Paracoccus aestuarii]|uniref:Pyridine nucleotide-disulfide oxidoreductase n=1 Tax=Paracoccus aestuarii TaxID=453842 RepID=A0A419A1D8_9RHOB|nr:FAD-dependent oxidoreductase [Paracoccus aestuarii]RJL06661.1 pyridine nucleotide-disulfide oxidoreductase [Paracoccus aestuarii]WCR00922.1 FAD-dependent oxidoreductase [Paracoccus aestuarii]
MSATILLLGAGHANLLAAGPLRAALPGARITLVDAAPVATYSGMFPGMIAGRYAADAPQIPLADFAARHGIGFRQARITGIDAPARRAMLADGTALPHDLAALDIGSHTAMPEIPGFADHAVPVKPMAAFAARLRNGAPGPAAVIGAGVAGSEIALALRRSRPVTLIEAGPRIAPGLGARAAAALRRALDRAGVTVLTDARPARITADAVILDDGRRIASALTVGCAGARAQDWLARDLPVDRAGFVRVGPTLQVEGHPHLLAAGDCAAMTHAPRPKAGVFAVRQAPDLVRNLVALHQGGAALRHSPQRDYLKIISLADGQGLAEWHGLTLQGRWLWRLKDRIDRRFMAGLRR